MEMHGRRWIWFILFLSIFADCSIIGHRKTLMNNNGDEMAYPPSGDAMAHPPSGDAMAHPPSGDEMAHPPSGDDKAHPPSGDDKAHPPSGDDKAHPPSGDDMAFPPVSLHEYDDHVVVSNGMMSITFLVPAGKITGIEYSGIDNILEERNKPTNRGYWDVVWNDGTTPGHFDTLAATQFNIITERDDQVEISFSRTWDASMNNTMPLNIDKRFIIRRGYSGFYTYAIFERLSGWPDYDLDEGRIAFKLRDDLFHYMAISDQRQRIMPSANDRANGLRLDYREAVLLTNPSNPDLKGEVDDKYQYSTENKDNKVHGWISSGPPSVGFWIMKPSTEFQIAGPLKQELTSHVGPTALSDFFSCHYVGEKLILRFRNGEPWKKVFGPVPIYLNSVADREDYSTLWADAKQQTIKETESWPYDFPQSEDYLKSDGRGTITGRLQVSDWFISKDLIPANSAYIGLANPGEVGSWQEENKGYQFWDQTDDQGYFSIENIRPGNYSLYAWVPGFIGDYKYEYNVIINAGSKYDMGSLVYQPPRSGPTLWEIGIPDRKAAEFYIPDPDPSLLNPLYLEFEKFRQYGLWSRYSELYPFNDLVYDVNSSSYQKDWFFAHVNRYVGNNTYWGTTWQILFDIDDVVAGDYTLQLAIAGANFAKLQVRINDPYGPRQFGTGHIGRENMIARHGIHGLYRLYSIAVPSYLLLNGRNSIYLSQTEAGSQFFGLMYDYIRLEQPSSM